MPPITVAPRHDEQITEWGSRPRSFKALLQFVKRGPRKAKNLLASAKKMRTAQASSVDDDDVAIITTESGGAAGQARVGRLRYDDDAGSGAMLQNLPLLQERPGVHHGQNRASPEAVSLGKAARSRRPRQDMATANDTLKLGDQRPLRRTRCRNLL